MESLGHVVSFGQELFVSNESSLKLVLLSELRSLKFFRLKFRLYYRCTVELLTCCKILCRRGARTIFEVCCVRESEQPDFCDWLAESSELTHVTVAAESHTSADCANMRDRVVAALANNSSIARLRLVEFKLKTAQLNMLCQNAREHRSLSEFVLTPACAISSQNCNGRSEVFRVALLQLQNVVSQNASRMSAAVKFVLGEDSGDGARAIEELRDHPWLPERVRDDAGLTDAEAQKKVKLAVNRVRNLNVHEFLWLTGVVRERRATPLDPDARGLHILEVPLVCWLYIRRYVNIADVASG
ncbi:hypothetical protein HPB52_012791 [Rhipicephalus sanguineus]|nr:hypothetical protein HPB52_012791 [Rhipicephalus sanguineus]